MNISALGIDVDFQSWIMIFMRISAFLLVLPFFSATNFPATMRVALGAFVAFLLAPILPAFHFSQLSMFAMFGVMFQEICIGLLLGFLSRMVFYAVDLAGAIISMEMGLNMAAAFNPLDRSSTQAPAAIMFFLAAVVMLSLDLHHWMLIGFEQTYTVLPIGGIHMNAVLFETVVKHTGRVFSVALQISAPMIAVSYVVVLVFAILSRAVPQMNVFSESFSFRIVGGLLVFGFTLQLMAQHVMNYLHRLPEDLLRISQLMGTR